MSKMVDIHFVQLEGEKDIISTLVFNDKAQPVVILFNKKLKEYMVCVYKKYSSKARLIDFDGNIILKRPIPKSYVEKHVRVLIELYDFENLPVIDVKKFIDNHWIIPVLQAQNWKTVEI
jgi:hypothetical protein